MSISARWLLARCVPGALYCLFVRRLDTRVLDARHRSDKYKLVGQLRDPAPDVSADNDAAEEEAAEEAAEVAAAAADWERERVERAEAAVAPPQ